LQLAIGEALDRFDRGWTRDSRRQRLRERLAASVDSEDRRPPDVDVERVAARHGLSGRFYRTAAGYRVILTDRKYAPGSPDSEALLKEFGADKMYARLCKMQASFRARLTPKPWRCEFHKPYIRFPFESPADEKTMQDWVVKYDQKCSAYATCQLVSTFGSQVLPEFSELIGYHDQVTRAQSGLRLA
jgi:hypothetical protein